MTLVSTPFVIGVAGGTSSGKTTISEHIRDHVGKDHAAIIEHDFYYRDLGHLPPEERARQNFDDPAMLENDLLLRHLDRLCSGHTVEIPQYDFKTATRKPETLVVEPREVIIVNGLFVLWIPEIRERLDLKVFAEADADERLIRRIRRDVLESDPEVTRERTLESVLDQYERSVRPSHLAFVEPSKQWADIIIPGRVPEQSILNLITGQIRTRIEAVSTLESLQQIGLGLSTRLTDTDELLRDIVQVAKQKTAADSVTLHLYDPDAQAFYSVERSKTTGDRASLTQPRVDGASAEIVSKGFIRVEDVTDKDPSIVTTGHIEKEGIRAYLGLRLQAGEETVGVLFLNYYHPHRFTANHIGVANALASFASAAIRNARVYEQSLRRLERLNQVGAELTSYLTDYEGLLQKVVDAAKQETAADSVTLHLYDPDAQAFYSVERSKTTGDRASLTQPRVDGASAEIVSKGFIQVEDVFKKDPSIVTTGHIEKEGIRAYLGLRLQVGEETVGVLFLNYHHPHRFTADQEAIARFFAHIASAAIRNARVYEQSLRRLERLNEVGAEMTSYLTDYEELLQKVVDAAKQETAADSVTLHLYDPDTQTFYSVERSKTTGDRASLTQPRASGATAEVLDKGFDRVEDVLGEDPSIVATEHIEKEGIRAYLGWRLQAGEEPVGVLFLNYYQPHRFTADQIMVTQNFANIASAAIHNARSYEKNVRLEKQREIISRNVLHHVVNDMGDVRLGLKFDLLEDDTLSLSPKHRQEIERMVKQTEHLIDESLVVAQRLRQTSPTRVLVRELVEGVIEFSGRLEGIELKTNIAPDLPSLFLDKNTAIRILSELVINAKKAIRSTGKPGFIEVAAHRTADGQFVSIQVSNNGPVIPADMGEKIFEGLRLDETGSVVSTGALGLYTTRQIVTQDLGGEIQLVSSDRSRTTFEIRLPTAHGE